MLKAFYFALHFAMIFLGVIIAIYVEAWIGLSIMGLFTVKFLLMFPDLNERVDQNERLRRYERQHQQWLKGDK